MEISIQVTKPLQNSSSSSS